MQLGRSVATATLRFNPKEQVMSETITRRNWLITGVSSGIGRSLAEAALAEEHVVVGTVRKPEQI